MTRSMKLAAPAIVAASLLLVGCGMGDHGSMWKSVDELVAVMHGTQGNEKVSGVVRFTKTDDGVLVTADISGLTPDSQHAIHVHEFGDCTDLAAKSAGGHYNPEGHPHGLPPAEERHAGDLGNLQADGAGHATLSLTVNNITLAGLKNPIVGRAVIVHALKDDGGQPTGNAGGRIACGVIGIGQSK